MHLPELLPESSLPDTGDISTVVDVLTVGLSVSRLACFGRVRIDTCGWVAFEAVLDSDVATASVLAAATAVGIGVEERRRLLFEIGCAHAACLDGRVGEVDEILRVGDLGGNLRSDSATGEHVHPGTSNIWCKLWLTFYS